MTTMLREGINPVEYLRLLWDEVRRQAVPFSGSIDLTTRCNLRCVHCYLGPAREVRRDPMSGDRICGLLDEMAGAGCLELLLTGGEPLLRPDFARIYRHARERGFIVSLFTNGTLIDREFVDLMTDLPPRIVEITYHGVTRETYEGITGVAGSFDRCRAGLELLREGGVPFRLKAVLMAANRHEFQGIRRMAADLGVDFRMDAAIFPRLDGDRSPLAQRLDPGEAVAVEFTDGDLARKWTDYCRTHRPQPPSDALYQCGAGRGSFHVKDDGTMVPCLTAPEPRYPLRGGDFGQGWAFIRQEVEALKVGPDHPCRDCDQKLLCGVCPAFSGLETGDTARKSEYLCALGRHRSRVIDQHSRMGGRA